MGIWNSAVEESCRQSSEILRRFQNKLLRIIVNTPRYVQNSVTQRDIPVATIKVEMHNTNKLANQLSPQTDDAGILKGLNL